MQEIKMTDIVIPNKCCTVSLRPPGTRKEYVSENNFSPTGIFIANYGIPLANKKQNAMVRS